MELEVLIACPGGGIEKACRIYILNSDGRPGLATGWMIVAISWMNPLGVWNTKRKGPKTKFWRTSAFTGYTGTEKPVNVIRWWTLG